MNTKSLFTPGQKRLSLTLLFIALFAFSLLIGADRNVNVSNLLKFNSDAWKIFFASRLPRTMAIVLTASGLSVAGLIMQSISNNKSFHFYQQRRTR